MAKKLDLTKMRAGQTVYLVGTDIHLRRDWRFHVRPLVVNNAPIPKFEGADYFFGGEVSRYALKGFVDNGEIHRRGEDAFFSTRKAAQCECDRQNKILARSRDRDGVVSFSNLSNTEN